MTEDKIKKLKKILGTLSYECGHKGQSYRELKSFIEQEEAELSGEVKEPVQVTPSIEPEKEQDVSTTQPIEPTLAVPEPSPEPEPEASEVEVTPSESFAETSNSEVNTEPSTEETKEEVVEAPITKKGRPKKS